MELVTVILLIFLLIFWTLTAKEKPPSTDKESNSTIQPTTRSTKKWALPYKVEPIDYSTYIKSDLWLKNPSRLAALSRDNYSCTMCDDDLNLEVHHITYKNLGAERPEELAVLCKECHNYTHKMAGSGAGYYPPLRHPLTSSIQRG